MRAARPQVMDQLIGGVGDPTVLSDPSRSFGTRNRNDDFASAFGADRAPHDFSQPGLGGAGGGAAGADNELERAIAASMEQNLRGGAGGAAAMDEDA